MAEQEDRDRAFMQERLAAWDDEREAEKGRESFYSDRFVFGSFVLLNALLIP
jgi:RNA-binding protein 25